jgi:acetyl esterase/lipase
MRTLKRGSATLVLAAWYALVYASPVGAQVYSRNLPPYRVVSNVTYVKSGQWEGKLDVYSRITPPGPEPTLVWMHGGDTLSGTKDGALFNVLPYLELGWNVVNVEHRLAGVTLAPAELQNALCALRWTIRNAREFSIDISKIVVSGSSSGGWFAVAAGLGVRPEGWSEACAGEEEPRVAAVVNWFGNWDLADILQGPNSKPYAPGWVRGFPNPLDVARALSPLPLRQGAPPVISIHGDADPTVPYTQSVRLHEALRGAHVPEKLITIAGGRHGGFSRADNQRAFGEVEAFLAANGLNVR